MRLICWVAFDLIATASGCPLPFTLFESCELYSAREVGVSYSLSLSQRRQLSLVDHASRLELLGCVYLCVCMRVPSIILSLSAEFDNGTT